MFQSLKGKFLWKDYFLEMHLEKKCYWCTFRNLERSQHQFIFIPKNLKSKGRFYKEFIFYLTVIDDFIFDFLVDEVDWGRNFAAHFWIFLLLMVTKFE